MSVATGGGGSVVSGVSGVTEYTQSTMYTGAVSAQGEEEEAEFRCVTRIFVCVFVSMFGGCYVWSCKAV